VKSNAILLDFINH